MIEDDTDPLETREWLDALDSVVREGGDRRASYLMIQLAKHAVDTGVPLPPSITTPFRNTISPEDEKPMP
ncbi:MAG: hypothetical protein NWQ45_01770, partial [Congregibacter sp.]|nr:hypothetical protein [Congregibacter sp.]